jgi:predicted transcriptional regulator
MTANTLHIRVDRPQNARDHIQERLAGIEDGDEIEERSVLYLKSVADLHRVFSPKNMELLKVVLEQEPRSVREAARFVDREPSSLIQELLTDLLA